MGTLGGSLEAATSPCTSIQRPHTASSNSLCLAALSGCRDSSGLPGAASSGGPIAPASIPHPMKAGCWWINNPAPSPLTRDNSGVRVPQVFIGIKPEISQCDLLMSTVLTGCSPFPISPPLSPTRASCHRLPGKPLVLRSGCLFWRSHCVPFLGLL